MNRPATLREFSPADCEHTDGESTARKPADREPSLNQRKPRSAPRRNWYTHQTDGRFNHPDSSISGKEAGQHAEILQ